MDIDDVRSLLSDCCAQTGGLRKWARAHKISAPYVSRVIAGTMPPGGRVLKALGLIKYIDYRAPRKNGHSR